MDRGAWQATVHGVAKSRTWMKWLSRYTCNKTQRNPQWCWWNLNPRLKIVQHVSGGIWEKIPKRCSILSKSSAVSSPMLQLLKGYLSLSPVWWFKKTSSPFGTQRLQFQEFMLSSQHGSLQPCSCESTTKAHQLYKLNRSLPYPKLSLSHLEGSGMESEGDINQRGAQRMGTSQESETLWPGKH